MNFQQQLLFSSTQLIFRRGHLLLSLLPSARLVSEVEPLPSALSSIQEVLVR